MLGKLLKHEFKDTAKLFLPLNAALLILSLLWAGLLKTGLFDSGRFGLLDGIFLLVYVLGIGALFIITTVSLALRFYKTMYGNQGYLTHTLPASCASVLNSKILTALAWLFLALAVCLLSVLILGFSLGGLPGVSDFQRFKTMLSEVFGIGAFPSLCLILALGIGFCFEMIMMTFASLSIGQLFHQYRIPAAIGMGILLYMIQQTASAVLILVIGFSAADTIEMGSASQRALMETSDLYRSIFLLAAAVTFAFGIIYYIICYVITKKKLNLE